MKNYPFLLLFFCALSACRNEQITKEMITEMDVGIFKDQPIESIAFQYDEAQQIYELKAKEEDNLRMLWTALRGDFMLDVKLPKVEDAGTYGLMLCTSAKEKTPIAALQVVDNQVVFMTAAQVNLGNAMDKKAEYLRLERIGNELTALYAEEGQRFRPLAIQQLDKDIALLGGLFAKATTKDLVFSNLRLTHPIKEEFKENTGRIRSRVEVFDIDKRHRKIVLEKNQYISSPTWHPIDSQLVVMSDSLLYAIELAAQKDWELIDTKGLTSTLDFGFHPNENVLFVTHLDSVGTRIYRLDDRDSLSPQLVTAKAPSIFQAVSPNGEEILYEALRGKRKNSVYKMNFEKQKEIRLSKTRNGNGGGFYAADGNKIYYHSARSRDTKIWEMNPLGLHQKQLTFDEFYDYAPQISPDGKTLVFLSYLPDNQRYGFPLMKQFVLRKLDLTKENAQPEILTPLLGGLGTLGKVAWSADSKKIAFISYSGIPQKLAVEATQKVDL